MSLNEVQKDRLLPWGSSNTFDIFWIKRVPPQCLAHNKYINLIWMIELDIVGER